MQTVRHVVRLQLSFFCKFSVSVSVIIIIIFQDLIVYITQKDFHDYIYFYSFLVYVDFPFLIQVHFACSLRLLMTERSSCRFERMFVLSHKHKFHINRISSSHEYLALTR